MVWPYSTVNRDNVVAISALLILALFGIRLFVPSQNHLIQSGMIIDLGRVSVGQTVEKPFSINNSSEKAIEILQWAPTCRCMQMRFDRSIIPPHSEAEAFVRTTALRPLGARAADIAIQWRYVGETFIRTDDLLAKARYVSTFSLSNERLDFGVLSNDNASIRFVSLQPEKDSGKWDELEASSDSTSLTVQVLKRNEVYKIQATLDPEELPSGVWKGTIRIFTRLNGVRTGDELDVPVVAKIDGPIRANPSVISLSSSLSERQFFAIKIRSTGDPISDLKFVGDLVQDPKVEISKSGREAVMSGFLATPDKKGVYTGRIPIQANNDPHQILRVSYFGFAG